MFLFLLSSPQVQEMCWFRMQLLGRSSKACSGGGIRNRDNRFDEFSSSCSCSGSLCTLLPKCCFWTIWRYVIVVWGEFTRICYDPHDFVVLVFATFPLEGPNNVPEFILRKKLMTPGSMARQRRKRFSWVKSWFYSLFAMPGSSPQYNMSETRWVALLVCRIPDWSELCRYNVWLTIDCVLF